MKIAAPAVLVRKHVTVAGGDGVSRGWDRDFEQGRSVDVARLAPVKARVRDENFHSRDEQGQEGQGDEPMRYANEGRVPRTKSFGAVDNCSHEAPVVLPPKRMRNDIAKLSCCRAGVRKT